MILPSRANAQSATTLERAQVLALARRESPALRVAEARLEAARAQRVGADLFVRENPVLSLWGGPRQLVGGPIVPDVIFTLSVPIDMAGSRGVRVAAAEAAVRLAEAELTEATQRAAGEALEIWVRALAARQRAALERARVTVEESALRVAQVRREHGAAGDDESALATVLLATARARVPLAEGELAAALIELRSRLGLLPGIETELRGALPGPELPPLEALLPRLANRADVLRASRGVEAARAEQRWQERLAYPVPRFGLAVGRENEYYGRVGVDVALPVFQRNQTAIAVARALAQVQSTEREVALRRADLELRVAYARYTAARQAWQSLEEALPAVTASERLALRAFELGRRDLAATLVSLREAAAARLAHLEAAATAATAALAAERAAGALGP